MEYFAADGACVFIIRKSNLLQAVGAFFLEEHVFFVCFFLFSHVVCVPEAGSQNAEQNAGASLRGRLRETCRPEERLRVMQRLPAVPASAFLVDIYIIPTYVYVCT